MMYRKAHAGWLLTHLELAVQSRLDMSQPAPSSPRICYSLIKRRVESGMVFL